MLLCPDALFRVSGEVCLVPVPVDDFMLSSVISSFAQFRSLFFCDEFEHEIMQNKIKMGNIRDILTYFTGSVEATENCLEIQQSYPLNLT